MISCFSKTQNGLSFWYRPTQVVLEKKAVKRLCVRKSAVYNIIINDRVLICFILCIILLIDALCCMFVVSDSASGCKCTLRLCCVVKMMTMMTTTTTMLNARPQRRRSTAHRRCRPSHDPRGSRSVDPTATASRRRRRASKRLRGIGRCWQ